MGLRVIDPGMDQSESWTLDPKEGVTAIPSLLGLQPLFSIYCLFELNSESLAVSNGFCNSSTNPENENP